MTTAYAPTPAAQAYRSNAILTASSPQLVVMLYDGARRFLHQTAVAMGQSQVGLANTKLTRAEDILRHLRATLDMEQGGQLADRLHGIYTFCLTTCAQARLAQNVAAVNEVGTLLGGLRDSWAAIAGE